LSKQDSTPAPTPQTDNQVYDILVSALKPYGKNPRVGNVAAIAESLKLNGQFRPIVVRKETQEILAGNHTWKAASALGWTHVKVTFVENITDEQAKKIVLADNRYGDLGGYNNEILAELLNSLPTLDGTGYDDAYLELIEAGLTPDAPAALNDPDDVPVTPELPAVFTKPGDVWLLGPHRLVCGDSTDADVYKTLMAGKTANAVVTDPPYNVAYTGGTGLTIQNDFMSDQDFQEFLEKAFTRMIEASNPGSPIYVFHSDKAARQFHNAFQDAGWLHKQILIWVKNRLVLSRSDYHSLHEPIHLGKCQRRVPAVCLVRHVRCRHHGLGVHLDPASRAAEV
jgi:site-specific DNA-methyltransferase (adenine-specific)